MFSCTVWCITVICSQSDDTCETASVYRHCCLETPQSCWWCWDSVLQLLVAAISAWWNC